MMYAEIRHRGCRVQSYVSDDVYAKLAAIRGLVGNDEILEAVARQFLPERYYVVRDIICALNTVYTIVGRNRMLDAIAEAFDLRLEGSQQPLIEVSNLPLLEAPRDVRR